MLDLKGRKVATGRAVAELLHDHVHHRDVLVCSRYWPAVEHVAELNCVQPVLSARNRAELATLVHRLASAERPLAVRRLNSQSLLEETLVRGCAGRWKS